MQKRQYHKRIQWTEEMDQRLENLYTGYDYTASEIARMMGLSLNNIEWRLKSLGIRKKNQKKKFLATQEIVRGNFHDYSYAEMAEMAGVDVKTIRNHMRRMKLERLPGETSSIRKRVMRRIWKKEKTRVLFGLEQKTKLKVVKARHKSIIRHHMRKKGYIVPVMSDVIYYHSLTKRNFYYEKKAASYKMQVCPIE